MFCFAFTQLSNSPQAASVYSYTSHPCLKQLLHTLPTGDMGVVADHVPTIAQLRPGVVIVHQADMTDMKKFFVSGGFAIVKVTQ
jgi:hypothetical protein